MSDRERCPMCGSTRTRIDEHMVVRCCECGRDIYDNPATSGYAAPSELRVTSVSMGGAAPDQWRAPDVRMFDSKRLDFLLEGACVSTNEDGDTLCLFLRGDEGTPAIAVLGDITGDEGEITEEDAPWLTEAQRANLSGTVDGATGFDDSPEVLRAAIDVARGIAVTPPIEAPSERSDAVTDEHVERAIRVYDGLPKEHYLNPPATRRDCIRRVLEDFAFSRRSPTGSGASSGESKS